jgi:two-component system phosphate regulon response regulator PhoB
MKRILIIEDETDVAEVLRYNLLREGFGVTEATCGKKALNDVIHEKPDLVLLDLMLPDLSGIEVCKQLKRDARTAAIPIIMVTAKSEDADIVKGLEAGADDYVTKPFSIKILISRIRLALRRMESRAYDPGAGLRVHELTILPGRFQVLAKGTPLEGFTLTEFKLLHFLAGHPGLVLNRQQILDGVRGRDVAVTERTVDVHVVGLRKKLGPYADYIEAVRSVGYRFRDK